MELFGRPANVEVAVHCYHFLLDRIEWLWRQNRSRFHPHARQARNSYLRGLVSGFVERLEQAGQRSGAGGEERPDLLPVCLRADRDAALRDFVARYHPRLVRRRGRRVGLHDQAYREAMTEGRKIVLHKVVTEQKSGCGLLRKAGSSAAMFVQLGEDFFGYGRGRIMGYARSASRPQRS